MNYLPLIIIGAPRSGTNMLRDILCSFDGIGTWPCDEINYIWRHGNVRKDTDEFDSSFATNSVKKFVRREFDKKSRKDNLKVVVEKTCANSLRVPFVNEVFPEAKYVFIYRDGIDVTGSAAKRWKAELDLFYILNKVRYVPLTDVPYYGIRYIINRIYRIFSNEKRLAYWGPAFEGQEDALKKYSLAEVCALQWKRCVDLTELALSGMPDDKVIRVSYESFVSSPETELKRIMGELQLDFDEEATLGATRNVSSKSVGKGRMALSEGQLKSIDSLVQASLKRYGYAPGC